VKDENNMHIGFKWASEASFYPKDVFFLFAGGNIMPNLSPMSVRKKYMLYDDKLGTGDSAEESLEKIRQQMKTVGREFICNCGDYVGIGREDIEND
jgi:hypothetical protein